MHFFVDLDEAARVPQKVFGVVTVETYLGLFVQHVHKMKHVQILFSYICDNNKGLHQTWRKSTEGCTGPSNSLMLKMKGQYDRQW